MEPNSIGLVVVLLLLGGAAIVAAVRLKHLSLKVLCGLLAMTMSALCGIAVVNDYYAYYQSWGQLSDDLSGSYGSYNTVPVADRTVDESTHGQVLTVQLTGARSGIDRPGLVYLPPQYEQPDYAHALFPVVELLHGSPGGPHNWVSQMHLAATLDHLIDDHLMGPVIAVMPAMNDGDNFQEGVDARGALDDTYLTQDVRTVIEARFRASTDPAEWGIAGYSSGGYAAANLALRHPGEFGASAIMDGYFRPSDGEAAGALHDDPAAMQANDPLLAASRLSAGSHPLPAFWVMVGTGDSGDLAAAQAFVAALRGVDDVPLNEVSGGRHNFDSWRAAQPAMLTWLWAQLAPPDLRVQFPLSSPTVTVGQVRPGARGRQSQVPVISLSPGSTASGSGAPSGSGTRSSGSPSTSSGASSGTTTGSSSGASFGHGSPSPSESPHHHGHNGSGTPSPSGSAV